jgi:hypothetical protein
MNRITVRPQIKDGESLSGYLIRISKFSGIKTQRLLGYICNELNIETKNIRGWSSLSAKLDLYPEVIIDLNRLGKLVAKSLPLLKKSTLCSAIDKFLDSPIEYKTLSGIGAFRYNRFFCPECLRQEGIYMLYWQIKEISLCQRHLIKLRTNCPNCYKEQPYMTDKLTDYRWVYCDNLLFSENETEDKIDDIRTIAEEKRKFEVWMFLINPNNLLFSPINLFDK